ncbi:hypothetical protein [Streptomyces parvulus]|uniref:hypothetical protein n=1 Tax=Streptomyces parvulus TaxID=146923 RepID=UPI003430109D
MSSEDSFHLEPERVHEGESLLSDLGSYTWSILAEFIALMSDIFWTGDDENGRKIKENYVSNRDASSASLRALGEVLERTSDATLMNLKATSGTQNDILDSISQDISKYDGGNDDAAGGRRD